MKIFLLIPEYIVERHFVYIFFILFPIKIIFHNKCELLAVHFEFEYNEKLSLMWMCVFQISC